MPRDDENVPEIAAYIVEIARERNYITDSLAVAPELIDHERSFFSALAAKIRHHVDHKGSQQLTEQEIYELFTLVYAKSCELAYHWRVNKKLLEPNVEDAFKDRIACHLEASMLDYFNSLTVPADFCAAFNAWTMRNPDYCQENNVHPILPLLEALKWTYRISLSLAFDYLD